MAKIPLHIQHNVTPIVLAKILASVAANKSIRETAMEIGIKEDSLPKRILPFVRQIGLLDTTRLLLTDLGMQFHQSAQRFPNLFSEAMHHLLYTANIFDKAKRFSWAYAKVVDALWMSEERTLDGEVKSHLVGMVVEEAAQTFDMPTEQVAFSYRSVHGVFNWLRALDPPVVIKEGKVDIFRRRHFCPAPSFLWAVDFLYRVTDTAYGVRLFLIPEHIERLCRACVLDPSGLDNVLMMTKRTSDYDRGGVFDYGTEGGFGRWILLTQPHPVPQLPG